MAVFKMTPVKGDVNKITKFAFEAATTPADGMEFQLPRVTEEYLVILVHNEGSGAGTIAVKAPENGSYAATSTDEELSLAAGEFAQIRVESARFANNNGTIKLVPSAATVKVAVLY